MWCLHGMDFKVNYARDCLISRRDFKWTLQVKMKKKKKTRQLCLSAMIYFFRPVTSKSLFAYPLSVYLWFCFLSFSCLLILF